MFTIRPVRAEDRTAIVDIHIRQSQHAYGAFLPHAYLFDAMPAEKEALWAERIGEEGAAPGMLIRVAESAEGAVAGFSCFVLRPDDPWGAYLHNLYVAGPFAGHGLGRKLFRAGLIDLPQPYDRCAIHLTAFAGNRRACALYDRLGGVIRERWMTDRPHCPPIETVRYGWPDRDAALSGLEGVIR